MIGNLCGSFMPKSEPNTVHLNFCNNDSNLENFPSLCAQPKPPITLDFFVIQNKGPSLSSFRLKG